MMLAQLKIDSPQGSIFLVASDLGLRSLFWERDSGLPAAEEGSKMAIILQLTARQLASYFAGTLKSFDVPLDLDGTIFQKKVWQQLMQIPFGATISYAQLAQAVGNPLAPRAVGTANGKNPVSIIVPCHRVIASGGGLGGYSGGLARKAYLLELEKAIPSQNALF